MPGTAKHFEPRWHAMVALVAVGGLRLALPHQLSVGPDWLLLAVIGVLVVLYLGARGLKSYALCVFLGYLQLAIVTSDLAWSLYLLLAALPAHRQLPIDLLRSAAAL